MINREEGNRMNNGKLKTSPGRTNFNNRNASMVKTYPPKNKYKTYSPGQTYSRNRNTSLVKTYPSKKKRGDDAGPSTRNPNMGKERKPGMLRRNANHSETPQRGQWKGSQAHSWRKMKDPPAGESELNSRSQAKSSTSTASASPMNVKEDESVKHEEKKAYRRRVNRIMHQKTSKGQPLMRGRIELMLEKIQSDLKGSGSK